MKKWLGFWIIGLTFLGFLMCFSAQAQTWKELFDQADSLYNVADYDSAIVVGKFALEKAEKEFGRDDTIVASVLHLLGKCYFEQG
ncbi:MAG TPA: tetratricopeptide repeat protein, partial [candidate division Zixibacteria bacterium]